MATQIISTSTIRPSSPTDDHFETQIDLTPWDIRLLFIHYIQSGLVYHLEDPKQQLPALTDRLKSSLSRTLNFFYPLAGRIAAKNNYLNGTTSFSIDCNNAGVEFVHAKTENVTVAEVMDPGYVPSALVNSFFRLNGARNIEGVSKPLLLVQATELVDGLFLGCSMNHAVAYGTSFWHFLNSWSEISRGAKTISNPPNLQRQFYQFPESPISVDIREESQRSFSFRQLKERVFHFTAESIARLKTEARAEVTQISTEKLHISTLQSVLAHVWRAIVKNSLGIDLEPNDDVKLRIPINWRTRLEPPLPSAYFGSAMHSEGVFCKARDATESGLGCLALKLNKMIAVQDNAVAHEFLRKWVESPSLVSFGQASKYMTIMYNSPRFDVYGTDFGWGKPVGTRRGPGNRVGIGGVVSVLPGRQEGSLDVEVCLDFEALAGMAKDQEFMEFVTQE